MENMNFQVNLQGIIDLLSNHLYSDPGVFVRELLQNGTDAIMARKRLGQSFHGKLTVELFPSVHTISIQDNGCGLTAEDIERFLSRIGSTSKKGELDAADDFIGQFGVGLLSCFIVSEEIVLITRSAKEGQSLEWRGKPDGTYSLRKLKEQVQIGTTIYLKAKPDYEDYFENERLLELTVKYGQFLTVPIHFAVEKDELRINEETPPWKMDKQAAADYIESNAAYKPLDVIPVFSRVGGVEGVAYVLPYAVSLQDEKRHQVYLKNMLLSDKLSNMLPAWAFFVNGIINTDGLRPTASREAFQENELFYTVRDELGLCIKRYLIGLSESNPELFKRIIAIHYHSIKAMAVEDEELYELFIRHLTFETSYGELEMSAILENRSTVLLTTTLDEFRQIARVAKAQHLMVVNGGYVHDFELVRSLPNVADVEVVVLDVLEFAGRFERLDVEERLAVQPFIDLSDRLLAKFQCRSTVRWFEPSDLPALYNTNEEVNFFKLAEESEKIANPLFAEIVQVIRQELYEEPFARLCYNYNNPIVRRAMMTSDRSMQKLCIELLYTQALLMGNHTMSAEELNLMNVSLHEFMSRGLNAPPGGSA
ncbi:HSP90 family protein [Paenibacillus sp. NPDC058071]|uniref:HSP90 family protein n=1 Tax=Paenibacillus sp. NPDC058071 TaxID=3346326 RepID=UPI0036D7B4AB